MLSRFLALLLILGLGSPLLAQGLPSAGGGAPGGGGLPSAGLPSASKGASGGGAGMAAPPPPSETPYMEYGTALLCAAVVLLVVCVPARNG